MEAGLGQFDRSITIINEHNEIGMRLAYLWSERGRIEAGFGQFHFIELITIINHH